MSVLDFLDKWITNQQEERTERVNLRQTAKTDRSYFRTSARGVAYANNIDPNAWASTSISSVAGAAGDIFRLTSSNSTFSGALNTNSTTNKTNSSTGATQNNNLLFIVGGVILAFFLLFKKK